MKIYATDLDGVEHECEGTESWQVMEILRNNNLPIKAECGGACACSTCQVYIDPEWIDKLPAASDEEIDMLDFAIAVEDNSRLSCQIKFSAALDGLKVTLAPSGDD